MAGAMVFSSAVEGSGIPTQHRRAATMAKPSRRTHGLSQSTWTIEAAEPPVGLFFIRGLAGAADEPASRPLHPRGMAFIESVGGAAPSHANSWMAAAGASPAGCCRQAGTSGSAA